MLDHIDFIWEGVHYLSTVVIIDYVRFSIIIEGVRFLHLLNLEQLAIIVKLIFLHIRANTVRFV